MSTASSEDSFEITMGESSKEEQIEQLKSYLKNIMDKQDELQKILAVKHNKAAAARRLSTQIGGESLRNLLVERDDEKHTVDVVETPGLQKRLADYSHNVDELEKELEETTKLVNEVATALAVISAGQS